MASNTLEVAEELKEESENHQDSVENTQKAGTNMENLSQKCPEISSNNNEALPDVQQITENPQNSPQSAKELSKSQQRQQIPAIDALSTGLLREFTGLRDLELQLEQIIGNQQSLLDNISSMNEYFTKSEEYLEVQLMVRMSNFLKIA